MLRKKGEFYREILDDNDDNLATLDDADNDLDVDEKKEILEDLEEFELIEQSLKMKGQRGKELADEIFRIKFLKNWRMRFGKKNKELVETEEEIESLEHDLNMVNYSLVFKDS